MLRWPTLLAVVVGAAACSAGGGVAPSDPQTAYVEAAATAFTSGNSGPALGDDTGRCVGEALVDAVGAPELTAAGVTAQELADAPDLRSLGVPLAPDVGAELAGRLGGCGLGEALARPLVDAVAEQSGGPLGEEATACVVDGLDRADLEAALAVRFVDRADGDAGFGVVMAAVAACPLAMAELVVVGFAEAAGAADAATRACVLDHVEANEAAAAASFTEGGSAATSFGDGVLAACPDLLG
jgi:hypothetical protein